MVAQKRAGRILADGCEMTPCFVMILRGTSGQAASTRLKAHGCDLVAPFLHQNASSTPCDRDCDAHENEQTRPHV
jgi:hypothetical protein